MKKYTSPILMQPALAESQHRGGRAMRVFLWVSFAIIVLALGTLEAVADRLTSEHFGAPGVQSTPTWLAR